MGCLRAPSDACESVWTIVSDVLLFVMAGIEKLPYQPTTLHIAIVGHTAHLFAPNCPLVLTANTGNFRIHIAPNLPSTPLSSYSLFPIAYPLPFSVLLFFPPRSSGSSFSASDPDTSPPASLYETALRFRLGRSVWRLGPSIEGVLNGLETMPKPPDVADVGARSPGRCPGTGLRSMLYEVCGNSKKREREKVGSGKKSKVEIS